MSHLDALFEKIFQEKLQLLEQEWLDFKASHEHWTEQKIYKEMLFGLRKKRDEMAESKWKSMGKPDIITLVFEYQKDLFTWFQSRHNDYKENPVFHFMHEVYPELRKRFDEYRQFPIVIAPPEISYPLREVFTEEKEVIEKLANYEAALKFINKLEIEESDILRSQRYPRRSESISPNENADLDFPDDVLDLIKKSHDDEAGERLSSYLREKEFSDDLINEAIQIQANLAKTEKDFNEGMTTMVDKNAQLARWRKSMIALIKRIQERL